VTISGENGEHIFATNTGAVKIKENIINYDVDLNLGPGDYYLTAGIKDLGNNFIELHEKIATFSVYSDYDPTIGGLTRMKYKYTIPKKK
jgi:hypothetical protein